MGKLPAWNWSDARQFLTAKADYPSFDPEQKQTVKADDIILAIGQAAELEYAGDTLKTQRGLIAADQESLENDRGGLRRWRRRLRTASVIHAIASGRKAATAIDNYLSGGRKNASAWSFDWKNPQIERTEFPAIAAAGRDRRPDHQPR